MALRLNREDHETRLSVHLERLENELDRLTCPGSDSELRLCQAMRYSLLDGGKRLRPLLVYASAEALGLPPRQLDAAACAVEMIHCYSLIHDDLPAMDDDNLRRGKPTAHLAFDEATAILAGDALQALAFETLAADPALNDPVSAAAPMIAELASACGAAGMAGGQAQDMSLERQSPDQPMLETMFQLKTGALIRAAVMMPTALVPKLSSASRDNLRRFAEKIGLAFQIRDDLLDIEGQTEVIGKTAGADQAHGKATWPGLFGVEAAYHRIEELNAEATASLDQLEGDTGVLYWLADQLINRKN
ncbi:MAG TPA: farnesyl diphosphate synthase [Wenzhouxiangella sp.]|nr:farnesyl diphosphate synthase [Wenzhouxiangella sp.]